MPAAMHRSSSPFMACAVIAAIGMCSPVAFSDSRMALVASHPFISGIWMSIRTRS